MPFIDMATHRKHQPPTRPTPRPQPMPDPDGDDDFPDPIEDVVAGPRVPGRKYEDVVELSHHKR